MSYRLSEQTFKSSFWKSKLCAAMICLGTATAGPCLGANIYSTDFETGVLGGEWSTVSELAGGRVQVFTQFVGGPFGDAIPHSGTYFLGMDHNSASGAFQTNEAWLTLDLSGYSNVLLDFWWMEWNDEDHIQDGVFLSDNGGTSFVKVQDLYGASYTDLTWQNFNLDLSALASGNGLSLTSNFVIKFQQHDNYFFNGGNDGFFFDDISVTGDVSDVPEPATVWMLGFGAALIALKRRRKS